MKIAVRRSLSVALAVAIAGAVPVYAGNLGPGEEATVTPADPAEDWTLDGATLTLQSGADALFVDGRAGSSVTIEGGTVTGALRLDDSTADLKGAQVVGTSLVGAAASVSNGATLTATASDISGLRSGVGLAGVATAHLIGTRVTASDTTAGAALRFFSQGTALVEGGSVLDGAVNAVSMEFDARAVPPPTGPSELTVDASHLVSGSGSAIIVQEILDTPFTADIILRNGTTVAAGNGVILETEGEVEANLTVDDSRLQGDIVNNADGTANIRLQNNASITGRMTNVSSLALDAATWAMTGDSSLGQLDLGTGTVSLGDGSTFNTLTVAGDFTGNNGTIIFNTVLDGDTSATDKLIIGGDTSGTANVRVNNVGGAGAKTDQGIELISVGGASNGQFNLAGRAVGGQYEYFLFKGTGADGNWYLRSQLPTQPDPCDTDPTLPECNPVLPGPGPDPEPVLRPEPGAYLANLQAAQNMFRIGYHDRNAGQNGGRAWARVDGSRSGFDAISRQLDIRGNSQALSVGADVWRTDNGTRVGVMLSSGNATSTSTNALTGYYARGKVKGEALGVYGTLRGGNGSDPYAGFYVDGSVQRAQFRNRVEGIGLADERYDSRAWQAAVEGGYAFRVGGASNGGIYLEPQLQIGYNRWDDYRHTEANGTVVGADNADGLFGRAGVRLSGVTRWGNGAVQVQPYVAANWLHNRSESQIRMDDEVVDARIPRNRGEFSAGASLKFASGVDVWGGLSLQKASGFHQTSAQVGVSYSW